MSKITNDGLTRSGTGCFNCNHEATVGVEGLRASRVERGTGGVVINVGVA